MGHQVGFRPDHAALVDAAPSAVAKWHLDHPNELLELRGIDLSNRKFCYLDLTGADLSGARLRSCEFVSCRFGMVCDHPRDIQAYHFSMMEKCDASESRWTDCDLGGVMLQDATFERSTLESVSFAGSILNNVDFSSCKMRHTDFGYAETDRTVLTQAELFHCAFYANDLSNVVGLSALRLAAFNRLSVDTIIRSRGCLPTAFLLACELPESWITFIPSLLQSLEPIQFYSCFLSYSSQDQAFADKLAARLRKSNIKLFYAHEDMRAGRKFPVQIDDAIHRMDKLLLVLSPASANSGWVAHEIKRARTKEKQSGLDVFFPIGLCSVKALEDWTLPDLKTGEDLADAVRAYHIPDFSNWQDDDSFERAAEQLIRDLKADKSVGDVKDGL